MPWQMSDTVEEEECGQITDLLKMYTVVYSDGVEWIKKSLLSSRKYVMNDYLMKG